MTRPRDMPARSAATIAILPDAFMDAPTVVAAYAPQSDARLSEGGAPTIAVELTRLVLALGSPVSAGDVDALTCALEDLERSHAVQPDARLRLDRCRDGVPATLVADRRRRSQRR